jgi:DNA-binding transcriptional LysR family regulator
MAFFPPLVAAFPAGGTVEVRLADEDVAQSEFPKLASAYDIVLAHRFAHTSPWPASVHVVPLVEEPLDVALPSGHPLARETCITAHRAAAEPWITTHTGFPVGAIVDALSAVTGRPVDVVHRVNEFTVAGELVRIGAGIALIPRWTSPRPSGVVLRTLEGVRSVRHIDALVRPENVARPAVRAVLDTLRGAGRRFRS